jgi:hypothetical protein
VPSPATRNEENGESRIDRLIEEEVAQGREDMVIDHEFAFPLCFPLSSGEGLVLCVVLALINQAPASAQKDGTYFARLRVLKR